MVNKYFVCPTKGSDKKLNGKNWLSIRKIFLRALAFQAGTAKNVSLS